MRCSQCGGDLLEGAAFCDHCGAKCETQKKQDPLIGRTLLNQYVIRSKLGEGGFGAVYEADQPSMRRRVAIKTLHRHLIHNPQIVARFHREGMAASQLEHPYAVRMFNSGETDDGILWLAMEFLSGQTLEERIKTKGPLSAQEFVDIMAPVCEVLGEAHQKGIVHRDLKPDNIMLVQGPSDRLIPKVLDFGIAGLLESEGSATKSGVISGTPKYMSPEQWEGLKNTDARSDIYSLGIISYQCLSGKLPFHADSVPQWMQKHCFEEPPSMNDLVHNRAIPLALIQAIMRSLQKKPSDRFQSMLEMRDAFLRSLKEPASLTSPTIMHSSPPMSAPMAAPMPPSQSAAPTAHVIPGGSKSSKSSTISMAVIGASLAIGGVAWFLKQQPDTKKPSPEPVKPLVMSIPATPVVPAGDNKAKCDAGELAACIALGDQYTDGTGGMSKDGLQAQAAYRKACDGGSSAGCFKLGKLFYKGTSGLNKDDVKSAEFFKKACDAKNYEGCDELALQYKYGEGVAKDPVHAAQLFLDACNAGFMGSCNNLGFLYERGEGITADLAKAKEFYTKGCDNKFGLSCTNMGWVAKKDLDYTTAAKFYTLGCDNKDGSGCDGVGLLYQDGTGFPQDDTKAKEWFKKGCDLGSGLACADEGFLWERGRGGAQDYAKALELYTASCDKDSGYGCYNLGYVYSQGLGTPQDRSTALTKYTKGCNLSHGMSCTEIGFFYEKGYVGAPNGTTAATFYLKGCDLGDDGGCASLGYLYQNGIGVAKDLAYAFDLYDQGCSRGHAISCGNLAFMYQSGKGAKKDKNRARGLYQYACDKGDGYSCDQLKTIK